MLHAYLEISQLKFSRITLYRSQESRGGGREKLSFDQFPVSLMSAHQELRNAHFSAKVKEISGEEI